MKLRTKHTAEHFPTTRMKEMPPAWPKTQTGHNPQGVGMDDHQVNTHFSYRTGINVPSGCRVPLEMNHVGTWRSDVPTHQGKQDQERGSPTTPAVTNRAWSRGNDKQPPRGATRSSIDLTVLRDQQTKDEKLEPQGSLPSRGTACHRCACGGKARTDHLPGHLPSSPFPG